MFRITAVLSFITLGTLGQSFPTIIDTVSAQGIFTSDKMIEGGAEVIGISDDFSIFEISNAETLYETHIHKMILYQDSLDRPKGNIHEDVEFQDIPITEQPPPPPPIPNPRKNYRYGTGLRISIDTTQIVPIPDYSDNSQIKLHSGETIDEIVQSELDFLQKYYRPSNKLCQGYPILVENLTDSIVNIETKEGWIYIVQEAKDQDGIWRPIEYIDYRAVCGNSYGNTKLLPGEYLISKIYRYQGDFQTTLRLRFSTYKELYFSSEFPGSINLSQFQKPEFLPMEYVGLNEHFLVD